MNSVAFIANHDSEFKWAGIVSSEFHKNGWDIRFLSPGKSLSITDEQLINCQITPGDVQLVPAEDLISYIWDFDVVVFITGGPKTESFLYQAREFFITSGAQRRPLFVTGFVGINIKALYSAFLQRSSADIVCVNSRRDLALYSSICDNLGIDKTRLRLTGLGIVNQTNKDYSQKPIRNIVFADQVAIPRTVLERRILYRFLADLAASRPDISLIIKPRHRPGETTGHQGKYPPESFFEEFPTPPNLSIDYTRLTDQFAQTDLLMTISSTAAFEALAHRINVAIVGDLGVSEVYGNHIFLGSNLIRTIDQVISDDIGIVDSKWINEYLSDANPVRRIYEEICSELEIKIRSNNFELTSSPYFNSRTQFYQHRSIFLFSRPSRLQKVVSKFGLVRGILFYVGNMILPPIISKPLYKFLKLLRIY